MRSACCWSACLGLRCWARRICSCVLCFESCLLFLSYLCAIEYESQTDPHSGATELVILWGLLGAFTMNNIDASKFKVGLGHPERSIMHSSTPSSLPGGARLACHLQSMNMKSNSRLRRLNYASSIDLHLANTTTERYTDLKLYLLNTALRP